VTHNCWHNCELTHALQCLAPAYGDEAHRKVGERMVEDMNTSPNTGPLASEYVEELDIEVMRLRRENADLLAALERIDDLVNKFDAWNDTRDEIQTAARAAIAKARK